MSTVTSKSYTVSADQHHQDKSRKFFRIVLILTGVIILFATLFLTIVIYRTIKSGRQTKSLTIFDSNFTDFNFNRSERACQYGHTQCELGATCTEQDECRCIFNCTANGKHTTGKEYSNQCQIDLSQCKSYYERNLTCSSIICSHGAQCITTDNGWPRCYCPSNCDEVSSNGPICGSDNQTYGTICELNKRACEIQQNLTPNYLGECRICQGSNCILNDKNCDPHTECSSDYRPLCADNLLEYSNECVMQKYSCQSNTSLTKLHDGTCYLHEQDQLREACRTFICLNGKTCMLENGIGVCRCLFNCSSHENQICASNGFIYRNLCEMKRELCIRGGSFEATEMSQCLSTCNTIQCPYGLCKQRSDGKVECDCKQCSTIYSKQELICGNNGITYPSKCLMEYDACTKHIDIKGSHMGQCNNCDGIICPINGKCRSEQGNYTCVCPARNSCSPVRNNRSSAICASNQELFFSQCELNIRSCELNTHLYTIAPHHCTKEKDQPEYTRECGYDESLFDPTLNRYIECDTTERCSLNSYCNKQTNRCCVKVITAVLPYRLCSLDVHCGKNMICLNGLCQCAREDFMPAKQKRECIALLPHLSVNLTCLDSPFGCCKDSHTISPTFDHRGCPEYCNCHPTGSLKSSCDPTTNSCYCRPAVGGLNCSYCENEYWAFSRILTHNNTGCTPCACHPYGSTRKDCLQDTGECSCHSFSTGRQCDKCIDSSLTLTDQGCVNLNKNRRRRQQTCRDLICLFDGICQILNDHPHCACHHVICSNEEEYFMNICASDGRTYKSKCDIKRQQCLKQSEITLIYPGICGGDSLLEESFLMNEQENVLDNVLPVIPIDSKRCITNLDCGENMVCLSEFCECAQQKYKRISGPRCITPQSILLELNNTVYSSVRHTSSDVCMRQNPCENHAICQDHPDGNYKCLCTYGWRGRHCTEYIKITIPYFNRQSYFELKSQSSIKYIDLIFISEHPNGLLLYTDDKSIEFYFIISIRNKIINLTIHLDHFTSIIQLSDIIELHTHIRLQIHILHNEIQAKLNNGNISSRLLPFDISLNNRLYLGGLPESFSSPYQQFHFDEGFQGCVHELSLNRRQVAFDHSQLNAQNIDECRVNPYRNGTRCIPIQKDDVKNSTCLHDDQISIDRCLTKPCEMNQHCINVYPNNYTCICLNCSLNNQYVAVFHSNSYIKRPPLRSFGDTGSSRNPIELNKWHQCSVEIYGQKLTLTLDQESPVISYELFSTNILWPRSFTFIGNLPHQYQSPNSYKFEGFRGAIQKIILNDHSLNDIRQHAIEIFNITQYHGYPCQPNPCLFNRQCHQTELNNYTCNLNLEQSDRNITSLELDGTINAVYPYLPSNFHRNYFDLSLKTKYSFGLIFYIGETSLSFFSRYLSLTLVNGFIQFSVKIDINSSAVSLKSKLRIDDGRWHRIEIERFRRRITMKLDNNPQYQTVSLGKITEFHPNPSYIHIGGYHRLCSYDEQHCRSYLGCLKNVTIDNNFLDLIADEINQDRRLQQCHDLPK